MTLRVLLTDDAARDLEEIHDYIAEHDSPAAARRMLGRFERLPESLGGFPDRGSHPRELLAVGVQAYRQASMKPYRIIYRRIVDAVYVYLIADGRRDMQTLLARRLLTG